MTETKTKWQLEHEKREIERSKGMKDLTENQLQAIKEAHRILKNVLSVWFTQSPNRLTPWSDTLLPV